MTYVSQQTNKFNLVLCEIFNTEMHGFTKDSDPNIKTHFLSIYILKKYINFEKINNMVELYQTYYLNTYTSFENHEIIRNYKNIVSSPNYIKPEIAQVLLLSGNEKVVIIKTFWIKIVQRLWKKVFNQRKNIIEKRKHVKSILYKETNGIWPQDCIYLPTISGMYWNTN
jgi:hypothetical protein